MIIEKFSGTDPRLYMLVGPLVMKASVLRQNNNYPFKTSHRHTWFVAVENATVVGFLPVEIREENAKIDNYYVSGDDGRILSCMLREMLHGFRGKCPVVSVTQMRHTPVFQEVGFAPVREWKRYVKMEFGVV